MTNQRPFALELLEKPSSVKLKYFKDITVPHRNLKEILAQLITNILEPADTSLFLIFGVTGVGKTTLRLRLEKILLELFLEDLFLNPGQIAVAGVEVASPAQGKFNHQDYYIRVLEVLNEVLISYKVVYDISASKDNNGQPIKISGNNSQALRRAMEKVFLNRQLRAFTIDEAQHLFATAGAHQLLNQMNWIKSIANLTKTVHILFGTYELLNCSTINGQVGRRSQDIHLSRYHKELEQDITEYSRIIQTFQRHLPVLNEPQLEKHSDYLLDYSLGCVGILKSWLIRALNIAIEKNENTLTKNHLQQAELSLVRRKQICEEAKAGEKRFTESFINNEGSDTFTSQQNRATASKSTHRGVGERKPQRDQVGVNSYDS
ncbi:MAG: AAA family ATPase [Nostoc sp.]|uniref:ATP-binding protein n=1 Tax=Nostoc sp. TaxID=1180 RepID=UPI002FF8DCD4